MTGNIQRFLLTNSQRTGRYAQCFLQKWDFADTVKTGEKPGPSITSTYEGQNLPLSTVLEVKKQS